MNFDSSRVLEGGKEDEDNDAECIRAARRAGDRYDGEIWSVLSDVHPPHSSPLHCHTSCAAMVSQSLSKHRR